MYSDHQYTVRYMTTWTARDFLQYRVQANIFGEINLRITL